MHGGWVGVFTSIQFREVLGLISDMAVKYQAMSSEMITLVLQQHFLTSQISQVNTQRARMLAAAQNLAREPETLALNPRLLHH